MQINKEGKRQSYGNKNNCREGCRTGEESRISVTGPPSANERIRHRDPTRASLCLLFSFSPLLGSRSRIRPILWKCRAQSRVFAIKMLNASRRVPQNVGFNGSEDARDPLKFARESFFPPQPRCDWQLFWIVYTDKWNWYLLKFEFQRNDDNNMMIC